MGLEQCKYSFFLKLLPSATISGCDPGNFYDSFLFAMNIIFKEQTLL